MEIIGNGCIRRGLSGQEQAAMKRATSGEKELK